MAITQALQYRALLLQTGIQLQDLHSAPLARRCSCSPCDRAPHARLLSAQCVTPLEFAGPPWAPLPVPQCAVAKPQLRLAPSAAWCPSEESLCFTLCQNPAAPPYINFTRRHLTELCTSHLYFFLYTWSFFKICSSVESTPLIDYSHEIDKGLCSTMNNLPHFFVFPVRNKKNQTADKVHSCGR